MVFIATKLPRYSAASFSTLWPNKFLSYRARKRRPGFVIVVAGRILDGVWPIYGLSKCLRPGKNSRFDSIHESPRSNAITEINEIRRKAAASIDALRVDDLESSRIPPWGGADSLCTDRNEYEILMTGGMV